MCVCDETGICPPACRHRLHWYGHDRFFESPQFWAEDEEREREGRMAADNERRRGWLTRDP